MANEMFDGFDHAQYQDEVTTKWGADAHAKSDQWWRSQSPAERESFKREAKAISTVYAAAQWAGHSVSGAIVQAIVARHYRWVAAGWAGTRPDAAAFVGLGQMYVDDERFAANYGGADGAQYVCDAMRAYVESELAS